jgi:hypothetical protein
MKNTKMMSINLRELAMKNAMTVRIYEGISSKGQERAGKAKVES